MGSRANVTPVGMPLWQRAVQLLATIEQHQEIGDSDHRFYTMVILTCARQGQSTRAAKMLELVERRFPEHIPDLSTCNAVINACAHNGEWNEALEVFVLMQWRGQRANVDSYMPLIRVLCDKGEWRKAVELLQEWEFPTPGAFAACIAASADARDWGKADTLFARAVRTRVLLFPAQCEVEWVHTQADVEAVISLDLRGFSSAATWVAVRFRLASLRSISNRDALRQHQLAGLLVSTDTEEHAAALVQELASLQPALSGDQVASDRSKVLVRWATLKDWTLAAM